MREVARVFGFAMFLTLLTFGLWLGEAWLGGEPVAIESAVVFLLVGVPLVILVSLVVVLRDPPWGDGQ